MDLIEIEGAGRWRAPPHRPRMRSRRRRSSAASGPSRSPVGGDAERAGSAGALLLRVQEIVPADPPRSAEARIRFLAPADAGDLVKRAIGDESAPVTDGRAATIVSVEPRQVVQGDITLQSPIDGAQPPASIRAADRVAAFDAIVRLGVDPGARTRCTYRSHPMTVGHASPS